MAGRSRARGVAILVLAVLAAGGALWWWLAVRAAAGEGKKVTYPDVTNDALRIEFRMLRWERQGDDLIVQGKERTVPVEGGEDAAWYDAGAVFHGYFSLPSYKDWPDNPLLKALGDAGMLPPTDVETGAKPAPDPATMEAYRMVRSISEESLPPDAHTDAGTLVGLAMHYIQHRSLDALADSIRALSPAEVRDIRHFFQSYTQNPVFAAMVAEFDELTQGGGDAE